MEEGAREGGGDGGGMEEGGGDNAAAADEAGRRGRRVEGRGQWCRQGVQGVARASTTATGACARGGAREDREEGESELMGESRERGSGARGG